MDAIDEALNENTRRRALPAPKVRRLIREAADVPQEALAKVVGVDRASISRYESGARSPRGDRLTAYIDALERLAATD